MLKTLWPSGALQGAAAPNNFFSADPEYGYSYNGIVKLDHKMSVNYGVRYDYFGPLYNHQKDLSIFVPAKGRLLFQGAGIPSLYPADWKNFAPRLGFAYRPRENGNLVVRAGFGIYYDEPNLNPFLANNPVNGGPAGVQSNPAGSNPVSLPALQVVAVETLSTTFSRSAKISARLTITITA